LVNIIKENLAAREKIAPALAAKAVDLVAGTRRCV
jgi:hypothetical protein